MKEHFEEYDELFKDLESLSIEIQIKKEKLYSLTATSYDDVLKTKSTKWTGYEHQIDEIVEVENRYKAKREEIKLLRDKHQQEIDMVEDKRCRYVLERFYLDHMSVGEIASTLYVSERHIKRIKAVAVTEFMLKLKNVTNCHQ